VSAIAYRALERIACALERQVELMEQSRELDVRTQASLEVLRQEQAEHNEACERWHKMAATRTGRMQ
jgi:hypothetical protein